jgi:hypothetical protein
LATRECGGRIGSRYDPEDDDEDDELEGEDLEDDEDDEDDDEDLKDDELEGDDLVDRIIDKGEEVFSLNWDSGGPGSGGGCESVYHWKGKFAFFSLDFDNSGPYASLDEALQEHEQLLMVTSATESIDCTLLTTEELAKRLSCEGDVHEIELNGEPWVYRAKAGEFKRRRVRG